VIISNERKASFNCFFFVYCYDFIGIGKVREFWPDACTNARNASFSWRATERDRAYGVDGYNFDRWEDMT